LTKFSNSYFFSSFRGKRARASITKRGKPQPLFKGFLEVVFTKIVVVFNSNLVACYPVHTTSEHTAKTWGFVWIFFAFFL